MDNQLFLAFDYGERRTGVAIGQSLTLSAQPLETISAIQNMPDWKKIESIISEWKPVQIVVGIPDNSSQNKALRKKIYDFCNQLTSKFNLPVVTHDETLSSDAAYRYLKSKRQVSKGKINKQDIDKISAAVLLESWMNSNIP
ncbi:MAG: Holliday junction resolvase RuvX [Pseudomonadota bacterium]